jgi:hypothetical protein
LGKITIEIVDWSDPEAPSPLDAGETPQITVNKVKGRPCDCDLTIVVLWGRLGTPLPADIVRPDGSQYESGTVWEFEDAVRAGKEVWVYRRRETPQIDIDDKDFQSKQLQYEAVKSFFSKFTNGDGSLRSGFNLFKTPPEFSNLFEKHLETWIRGRLDRSMSGDLNPIGALLELAKRNPEIPRHIAVWRVQFQISRQAIDSTRYYKNVHDLLHTLRVQFFGALFDLCRNAHKSPEDPSVWKDQYDLQLEDQLLLFQELNRGDLTNERVPGITTVVDALQTTINAIEMRDITGLEEKLRRLFRNVGLKLSWTNHRLAEEARHLPLAGLITALKRISENLERTSTAKPLIQFEMFQQGIEDLVRLEKELNATVVEHDKWQEIDDELRQVDAVGIRILWADLKTLTDKRCDSVSEDWALKLQNDSKQLEVAIRSDDESKIEEYFRRYRHRVERRFYDVDKTVKELCEKLARIGEPLAQLIDLVPEEV